MICNLTVETISSLKKVGCSWKVLKALWKNADPLIVKPYSLFLPWKIEANPKAETREVYIGRTLWNKIGNMNFKLWENETWHARQG